MEVHGPISIATGRYLLRQAEALRERQQLRLSSTEKICTCSGQENSTQPVYLLGQLCEDAGQDRQQLSCASVCADGYGHVAAHQVRVNPQQRLQAHQHSASHDDHLCIQTQNGQLLRDYLCRVLKCSKTALEQQMCCSAAAAGT